MSCDERATIHFFGLLTCLKVAHLQESAHR
jgi:hypothetical protein